MSRKDKRKQVAEILEKYSNQSNLPKIDTHVATVPDRYKAENRYGQGNIDLTNRPVVKNSDGSISTVRSMSFYDDKEKKEILIPTVVNGKVVSDNEAIDHYRKTGQFLGKFNTVQEANDYAERLHQNQEKMYGQQEQQMSTWDKVKKNAGFIAKYTGNEAVGAVENQIQGYGYDAQNYSRSKGNQSLIAAAADAARNVGGFATGLGTINSVIDSIPRQFKILKDTLGSDKKAGEKIIDYISASMTNSKTAMPLFSQMMEMGNLGTEATEAITGKDKEDIINAQTAATREISRNYENRRDSYEQDESVGNGVKTAARVFGQVGRMLPTIATSTVAGEDVGLFYTMGQSVMGSTVNERLDKGETLEEAVNRGNLEAAKEVATEKMFGGLHALGGGVVSKLPGVQKATESIMAKPVMKKIEKILGSKVLSTVKDALGESIEEIVSDVGEYFINIAKGEDTDLSWSNEWETTWQTWLTTLILNGLTDGMVGLNTAGSKAVVNKSNLDVTTKSNLEDFVKKKSITKQGASALVNGITDIEDKTEVNKLLKSGELQDVVEYVTKAQQTERENIINSSDLSDEDKASLLRVAQAKNIPGEQIQRAIDNKLDEDTRRTLFNNLNVVEDEQGNRTYFEKQATKIENNDDLKSTYKKYYGNNKTALYRDLDNIENIGKEIGARTIFDGNEFKVTKEEAAANPNLKEGAIKTNVEAFFRTRDGKTEIVINPYADTKKSFERIFSHELTHGVLGTNTEEANYLKEAVEEYYIRRYGRKEYNNMVDDLKKVYGKNYNDEEITAKTIEQLFTSQDDLNELANSNPNIFTRIYRSLVGFYAKLTGSGKAYAKKLKLDMELAWSKSKNKDSLQNASNKYSQQTSLDNKLELSKQDSQGRELSKEQQEYFKNSKVRDENGNLIPMYHGTKDNFTVFEYNKGNKYDSGYAGKGFYFVDDIKSAREYSEWKKGHNGNRVIETYLNITNPLDLGDVNGIKSVLKERLGLENLSENPMRITEEESQSISNKIKEMGYDGLIYNFDGKKYAVVYDSNQIKNVDNTNPTSNPDTRYSIETTTDNKNNKVNPNMENFMKNSYAREDDSLDGRIKELYHGTNSGEFFTFDRTKGSSEGDWGAGFYLTDSEADVEANYEGGGPDFENKVSRLAERLEEEKNISYEEAKEIARERLEKGSYRITAYANITNPVIVGKTNLFDTEYYMDDIESDLQDEAESYQEEIEEYAKDYFGVDSIDELEESDLKGARDEYLRENGIYDEIVQRYFEDDIDKAVYEVSSNLETYQEDELRQILWDAVYEGGIGVEELKNKINNQLEITDDEGNLANNEAVRLILESLGYDGIIDHTVSDKFSNMNMPKDTTHYIVFNSNQIKDTNNQNPTENPDRRYSIETKEISDEDAEDINKYVPLYKLTPNQKLNRAKAYNKAMNDMLKEYVDAGAGDDFRVTRTDAWLDDYLNGESAKIRKLVEDGALDAELFKRFMNDGLEEDIKEHLGIDVNNYTREQLEEMQKKAHEEAIKTKEINEKFEKLETDRKFVLGEFAYSPYNFVETQKMLEDVNKEVDKYTKERDKHEYGTYGYEKAKVELGYYLELRNFLEGAIMDDSYTESTKPGTDDKGYKVNKSMENYMKDSKMRTKNGNLIRYYHTMTNSGKPFTVFNGVGTPGYRYGSQEVNFFTPSPIMSASYANFDEEDYSINSTNANKEAKYRYSGYLNIQNPYTVDAGGENWDDIEYNGEVGHTTNDIVKDIIKQNCEKLGIDSKDWKSHNFTAEQIRKAGGYDGVVIKNVVDYADNSMSFEPHDIVVTFSSNQFKLAENENPTENPDTRYSINTDSQGRELSKEQQKYFKDSKVRDENGSLMAVYHGASNPGFTIFEKQEKSQFGKNKFSKYNEDVSFFTSSKENATSYTELGIEEDGNVYEVYLDIKKPYVVQNETKDGAWNNIKDKNIREIETKYKDRFEEKWSARTDESIRRNLDELNNDLNPFGLELREVDGDYDVYKLSENSLFGSERPVMFGMRTIDELFDYDIIEEMYGGDFDDYFYTTNDIVKWILEEKNNGSADYDGIIIENIFDSKSMFSAPANDYITFNSNQIKRVDNKNPTKNPDIRYSIETNPDGTLLAAHNLFENELEGILDLGGIPGPSIAVYNPDVAAHTRYGPISLIFKKDTVDPQKDIRNKTFGADVYSPTFPQINYDRNRNDAEIDRVADDIGIDRASFYNAVDTLNPKELVGHLESGAYGNKLTRQFAEENNIPYEIAYENDIDKLDLPYSDSELQDFIRANNLTISKLGKDEKIYNEYKRIINDIYESSEQDKQRALYELDLIKDRYLDEAKYRSDEVIDSGHSNNFFLQDVARTFGTILNPVKTVDDYYTTRNALTAIQNIEGKQTELEKWIEDKIMDAYGEKGIWNGKQGGSFWSRHNKYNLENLVKAITGNIRGGEKIFYGPGSIRSQLTQEFKSIDEMHESENKLISPEEMDKVAEMTTNKLSELGEKLSEFDEGYDSYGEVIQEIAKRKRINTKVVQDIMQEHDFVDVSDEVAQEVVDYLKMLKDLPTAYFESKPQRAVGLNEIGVALIPNNLDETLKKRLKQRKINTIEYDPNIEGDREAKQRSAELQNLRFSLETQGDWTEYLTKYSKGGTKTYLPQISGKLPTRKITNQDFLDVISSKRNLPQEEVDKATRILDQISKTEESLKDFDKQLTTLDDLYAEVNLEQEQKRFDRQEVPSEDRAKLISKKRKEFNKDYNYDRTAVNKLDEQMPRNRNGARTVAQWKQMAKDLGKEIANLSPEEIEDIAVKSWYDLEPNKNITTYDSNLHKKVSYENFKSPNAWINSVYDGVRENRKFSVDINNVEQNQEEEVPKLKKTLNPSEISNLKPEDVSTTPMLPDKRIAKGDKASEFVNNINNKVGFLDEETKKVLTSDENVQFYKSITNAQTLSKAYKDLSEGGNKATYDWYAKESSRATPEDIAKGWILMKQYSDNKDTDNLVRVARKMRDMGTKSAQTLQAFNILARLTPEGMASYAQMELQEAYDNMIKGKSKAWIDAHKTDFELSQNEIAQIMDIMTNLPAENPETNNYERKVALGQVQKIISEKIPNENGKIKAWMRISMLFNPKTQVRNVAGNAGVVPVNMFSDFLGSKIDKMIAKQTGIRTLGTMNKGYLKGMKEGFYQSYNDFRLGINTRDVEGNKFELGTGKTWKDKGIGKALNRTESILNFVMDFGDRGFSQAAFVNSLNNQMLLNGVTKPTQEMIDIAQQEALSRTWNDNNEYTKFVLGIRAGLNKIGTKNYGLGDVLIPFAKTPANLTKAIVDYSPVGFTKQLFKIPGIKNAIETGQFTAQQQHDFVDLLGKGMAGSLLYVAGYALAAAGIASGAGDDDKDVRNFMRYSLGIQPYSIKVGNKSFTYDWSQPIATPLAIMSNLYKQNKENPDATWWEKAMNAANIGTNQLLEQSFMESLNEVLNGNGEITERIQKAIFDLPARAIPTFAKQIADMVDSTQRTSFEYGQPGQTSKNAAIAKLPGLSKDLTPSVDTLGNDIEKYGGENNFFNVFFNPANMNKGKKTEAAQEIYDVYEATGDTSVFPVTAPYYVNYDGEKITMSSKERAEYQRTAGKYTEKAVNQLINDSNYQSLSDDDKAEILSKVVTDSNEKAKRDVLNITKSSSDLDLIEEIGSNYYTYKSSEKAATDAKRTETGNSNASLSDTEKINVLRSKNYTDQEKESIYTKEIKNEDDKVYNSLKAINNGSSRYIDAYLDYKSTKFESDREDDGTLKGKAISGSKKEKVEAYLKQSNFDSFTKLYLYGTQYKLDSAQRQQFERALNQKALTPSQKKEIYLTMNGVTEMKNGSITWK